VVVGARSEVMTQWLVEARWFGVGVVVEAAWRVFFGTLRRQLMGWVVGAPLLCVAWGIMSWLGSYRDRGALWGGIFMAELEVGAPLWDWIAWVWVLGWAQTLMWSWIVSDAVKVMGGEPSSQPRRWERVWGLAIMAGVGSLIAAAVSMALGSLALRVVGWWLYRLGELWWVGAFALAVGVPCVLAGVWSARVGLMGAIVAYGGHEVERAWSSGRASLKFGVAQVMRGGGRVELGGARYGRGCVGGAALGRDVGGGCVMGD
jgi:hypothetical protein